MAAATWCLRLTVPAAALDEIEAALSGLGGALASGMPDAGGAVLVEVYCQAEPARADIAARLAVAALAAGIAAPDFEVELLPDLDWVVEGRKALPPIHAGPFYVFGAHVTEPPPAGSIPLQIEANAAFGTGRHETTSGCLLALAELRQERQVRRALDMGCGTGILALAAAKLWGCPVLAVDNDAEAVRVARENAAINEAANLVRAEVGDGYACPAAAEGAPYDLIVANILAGPLIDMAAGLKRFLAPGGVAVLSGLLADQAPAVLEAHRPLRLIREHKTGDWSALVIG